MLLRSLAAHTGGTARWTAGCPDTHRGGPEAAALPGRVMQFLSKFSTRSNRFIVAVPHPNRLAVNLAHQFIEAVASLTQRRKATTCHNPRRSEE